MLLFWFSFFFLLSYAMFPYFSVNKKSLCRNEDLKNTYWLPWVVIIKFVKWLSFVYRKKNNCTFRNWEHNMMTNLKHQDDWCCEIEFHSDFTIGRQLQEVCYVEKWSQWSVKSMRIGNSLENFYIYSYCTVLLTAQNALFLLFKLSVS